MELAIAIAIGSLYAAGAYLFLRRSIVKLILAIVLISQAANLVIFTSAGLTPGSAAFVAAGEKVPPATSADPLPQALILTAIVIGFAVLAFTVVMVQRVNKVVGTEDLDAMRGTDS